MNNGSKTLITLLIFAIIAVGAWGVLTMPDQRTTGKKVGDAIDTLPQGIDKAAKQLESRTPGEKLGDAVEETGEKIKTNTQSGN